MFDGENTYIKIVDSYRVLVKSAARDAARAPPAPFGDGRIGQHT